MKRALLTLTAALAAAHALRRLATRGELGDLDY